VKFIPELLATCGQSDSGTRANSPNSAIAKNIKSPPVKIARQKQKQKGQRCSFLLFDKLKTKMIKGWQKTSFIDYPGKISTVIFFSGCNFRCRFCHNPDLVFNRPKLKKITEEEIINFLNKRKKIIEAVVVSGGEPTLMKNLDVFLAKIKALGYLIKLDTNGTNPEAIKSLLAKKLIDYLAMDIKGPLEKYSLITQRSFDINKIKESVKIIMQSGLPYEFRSTILPLVHQEKVILAMAEAIKDAEVFYLQKFVSHKNLVDRRIAGEKFYSQAEMADLAKKCRQFVKKCLIR
jgi:pyruvate formate lyase activating enzyme